MNTIPVKTMNRLKKLLEAGENEMLDFKKEISSSQKIAKTIISFANRRGGTILVGVRDDKTICGIQAEEEKHMIEQAAGFFSRPEIEINISEHTIGKRTILEVIIPEGKDKPYFAKGEDDKWWAYIRVKDQSLLASKIVLEVLRRESNSNETLIKYSTKEKALFEYLEKNDRITLKQYCKLLNISRRMAQKILVNLISVGMVRSHTTEKEEYYTIS